MRIWHVGHSEHHLRVDGVNAVVWLVARAQAGLGANVVLVNKRELTPDARSYARKTGVGALTIAGFTRRNILRALTLSPPSLVHFHSVFVPRHAVLACMLRAEGIPYVVTPHGGVARLVLQRGRIKKWLYSALVERRLFHGAVAVTAVTEGEMEDILAFAPGCSRPVRLVPNPVDSSLFEQDRRRSVAPVGGRPRLTYLGRYDVHVKGIDRLYRIAEFLPEADVRLVGAPHRPARRAHQALERRRPPNLQLVPPVFGAAKIAELDSATMYLQMSRSEAMPVSVAEAMARGVPVAVASSMHFARVVAGADAGLVLGEDPRQAAEQLRDALCGPDRLASWGRNGVLHACRLYHPAVVARAYLQVYDDVLQ